MPLYFAGDQRKIPGVYVEPLAFNYVNYSDIPIKMFPQNILFTLKMGQKYRNVTIQFDAVSIGP